MLPVCICAVCICVVCVCICVVCVCPVETPERRTLTSDRPLYSVLNLLAGTLRFLGASLVDPAVALTLRAKVWGPGRSRTPSHVRTYSAHSEEGVRRERRVGILGDGCSSVYLVCWAELVLLCHIHGYSHRRSRTLCLLVWLSEWRLLACVVVCLAW
jgi:hypothetical protein